MKKSRLFYHAALILLLTTSLVLNYKLSKRFRMVEAMSYDSMAINSGTEMKLEMALHMLSNEGPREIERIAREVIREEIKKLKQENNEN